jgi:16S rRNA (adenine1518-N6/adenine1519-N6)-dimethyltransferase
MSALLKAANLKPKKSAGQNFLADFSASDAIVKSAALTPEDTVLEIGAGLGSLTLPLARAAGRVFAVEWDRDLAPLLEKQIESAGITNAAVIQADILSLDTAPLAAGGRLTVFGNLPYNISSQILVKLVRERRHVSRAFLMFQKELARRILAKPGKKDYGRITVLARYAADIRPGAVLPPACFLPRPGVDSMVLAFTFHGIPPSAPKDEDFFFRVVKAAFANRRKTLKNALVAGGVAGAAVDVERALGFAGIEGGRRAETLDVAEFARLADALLAGKED